MLGVGGGGNKSVKFVNRGRVSQIPSGLRNAVPWIFFDHFPIIFQDDPTFVLMIPQNDLRGGDSNVPMNDRERVRIDGLRSNLGSGALGRRHGCWDRRRTKSTFLLVKLIPQLVKKCGVFNPKFHYLVYKNPPPPPFPPFAQ